jgi:putative transposase
MLAPLLAHLAVARPGPGRPRTRPDALIADKAYSSRAIRSTLRSRRIKAVIPQPADQIAHRTRRGSAGGRPPAFDAETYKGRNVIERSFNDHTQWRGLATRYDKLARVYRGGVVLRAITIWLRE